MSSLFLVYNFLMSNKLIKNIEVKYSEMDHNLALKPFSLLNFLQDIASESAENLGFGYSFMTKNNFAWFLIKYRMEFNDYPVGLYDLTLTTKPRGYNRLFAYREFDVLNNEMLLGRIFSMWSIVDMNSRTTVPIQSAICGNENMLPYQKLESDLSFLKIKSIQNISLKKEFEVRYNDLDVNGHANNGNYIVWAFEPLTFDFKNTHRIKTLDMVYKKEAKFGETLISQIEFIDKNTTIHKLQNSEGEDLFQLQCVWI